MGSLAGSPAGQTRSGCPRTLRPGDLGRQGCTGEALGIGPEPGGCGGVAGPARWPDGDGGTDEPEAPAGAVVAAVDGVGAGRGGQQRLGPPPDPLRWQGGEAVGPRP